MPMQPEEPDKAAAERLIEIYYALRVISLVTEHELADAAKINEIIRSMVSQQHYIEALLIAV